MKRILWLTVFTLLASGSARAETKSLQLTIAAVKEDRLNVPVSVQLALPKSLARASSVIVQDAAGTAVVGQLTAPGLLARPAATTGGEVARELHFILPSLKAGESATFKATLSTDSGRMLKTFRWMDQAGDFAELSLADQPVLRYMYKALDESSKESREQTYKVYHHLYDPSGKRFVTKGPGGQYTHHRGLYFGFNRVSYGDGKKADTWHCTKGTHQSHQGILASETGFVLGRHLVAINWHGEDKEVFAKEERELTVYRVSGGILVEFASRLKSTVGKVKLDGDPQHAGFQFRADDEVSKNGKANTYYLRPDGQGKPGETRNWEPKTKKGPVNLPWNAMSFVLGDQRFTVCYLDKPTNPKEARFSERDYGRFGSYFEYEIDNAKPLDLNYRIWLQTGEMAGPGVARLSTAFVNPVDVTVK